MPKTQIEPLLAPRGGLRFDLPGDLISPLEMTECQNVFFEEGLIKKRYGYKQMGGNLPLSGPIMGSDQYYKFGGSSFLLVMTTKDVYKWNSNNKMWEIITPSTDLDRCTSGWSAGSGDTVAADADEVEGTACTKVTLIAERSDGDLLAYKDISSADITSRNSIGFWLKSSANLAAEALELVVSEAKGGAKLKIAFDSGGTAEITVGDTITGATSGATAKVCGVTVSSGTWAGGDAAGELALHNQTGTFVSENLNVSGKQDNIATIGGDSSAPTFTDSLSTALTADTWTFVRVAETLTDLNAVLSVGLYANATIASATVIRIDDIRAYTPFTGQDDNFFDYDYIRKSDEEEPRWICTNGVDSVKYWDGITSCLSDLEGSPPLAKRAVAFKEHLHLLYVTSGGNPYPQRIQWSDTGDPTNWSSGNSKYADLPGADWISNAMRFKGDYMIVLKERSIEVGYATGDTFIFNFDSKVTGAGCAAPLTIESLGDEIVFLGWDDVYVFNGIDYEPIGTPIQKELFRRLNPEQIGRCFGVIIEEQKEYWLFTPSTDKSHIEGSGVSTYPDIAWCFNYDLNKWTMHSFGDFITMFGYYFLEAAVTWDDLTGTWDQQTWRWDDRTILKHAPTTIFGDKDGYVYEYDQLKNDDDDSAIDAYFDTKDFNFTQLTSRQRVLRLDCYYTGNGLDVSYSIDKGDTWTAIGTLDDSVDMETPRSLYLRLDCNMVRFRFRNNTASEHFEFSRANIYWQPAGGKL
jgi:hypothetical protein